VRYSYGVDIVPDQENIYILAVTSALENMAGLHCKLKKKQVYGF